MLKRLKMTEKKLQYLENKRGQEIGYLALKCGLEEKDNHHFKQDFIKLAKEYL